MIHELMTLAYFLRMLHLCRRMVLTCDTIAAQADTSLTPFTKSDVIDLHTDMTFMRESCAVAIEARAHGVSSMGSEYDVYPIRV